MAEYTKLVSKPKGLATVELSTLGATLVSYTVNSQTPVNVVCGFTQPESYRDASNPYFGTTVGRVANRIKDGSFELNGQTYRIEPNAGSHVLHGGAASYHLRLFEGPSLKTDPNGTQVAEYRLLDEHSQKSFPGSLQVTVRYYLRETSEHSVALDIEYAAELTGNAEEANETLVNLTNHSYFNVTGNPSVAGMQVELATNTFMEVDDALIPTGTFAVHPLFSKEAPFKVTLGAESGSGGSSDHCFVLEASDSQPDTRSYTLRPFATLSSDRSGVTLEALTTEPSFQFYTGDGMNVTQLPGETRNFGNRSGVCLEAARLVDAARFEAYRKQTVLKRGDVWGSLTRYAVSF